jgi:CBS domain-containing protein
MPYVDTTIGTLPLDDPLTIAGATTLRETAAVMARRGLTCVLVATEPAGLVTDHDLAGALAAGHGPDVLVEEIATRAPVWAAVDSTLIEAVITMVEHRIRHLLVVDGAGRPQGVLSLLVATQMLLDVSVPLGPWPWP